MYWLFGLLERFLIALIAILFTQIPSFIQQYSLILKGHLEEIARTLTLLKNDLASHQSTILNLIQKLSESTDADLQSQGKIWEVLMAREEMLRESFQKITESPFYLKPVYLFGYFNSEIARETYDSFIPSINFNLETLLFAFVGVLFGSFLFFLLKLPFKKKRNFHPPVKSKTP